MSDHSGGQGLLVRVGRVVIRARLQDTELAARLFQSLPIYGVAGIGAGTVSVRFVPLGELPTLRTDASARPLLRGQIGYSADRARIVIAWADSPMPGVQVWAIALDDVGALAAATVGMRVAILQADS
ncbi:MAG: hypothetical protein ABL898_11970 [Hyphomicrobiaceae bacterium]